MAINIINYKDQLSYCDQAMNYTVHTPTPIVERSINKREKGRNQKLQLLRRGKVTSVAPNCNGRIILPKPPIKSGMRKKKIITIPWPVINVLYEVEWDKSKMKPAEVNSIRIRNE